MFYKGSYRPHPSAVGEEYGPLVHKGPSKGLIGLMDPQSPGHPHLHLPLPNPLIDLCALKDCVPPQQWSCVISLAWWEWVNEEREICGAGGHIHKNLHELAVMYLITGAHSIMSTFVSRFLALFAHIAIIHLIKVLERQSLTLIPMAYSM